MKIAVAALGGVIECEPAAKTISVLSNQRPIHEY